MDPLKLGLRNLIGVTVPGTLLLMALVYCSLSVSVSLGWPVVNTQVIKEHESLLWGVSFILSYVFGSLIRLHAADAVDRISARWCPRAKFPGPYPELKTVEDQLQRLFDDIVSDSTEVRWAKNLFEWVYLNDRFPYPVWQFMKFKLYHPSEMFRFFRSYRNCFGTKDRRAKEFFNYCKMVIYSANRERGGALAEEVQAAEGYSRFFAGSFYAFRLSAFFLLACGIIQVAEPLRSANHVLETLALTAAASLMAWSIVARGRFRLLRLKEVDMVFDAFYLVHRHAEECSQCSNPGSYQHPQDFLDREKLVKDAFVSNSERRGPIELPILLKLMKERSTSNPSLSCIYFAGARGDHPFFLKTSRIAMGVSVLPEDAQKAGLSKRHPFQTEVMFVLDGSVHLEIEESGHRVDRLLKAGDVAVINPGQCHRVAPVANSSASYVFVKTDPAREPVDESCSL